MFSSPDCFVIVWGHGGHTWPSSVSVGLKLDVLCSVYRGKEISGEHSVTFSGHWRHKLEATTEENLVMLLRCFTHQSPTHNVMDTRDCLAVSCVESTLHKPGITQTKRGSLPVTHAKLVQLAGVKPDQFDLHVHIFLVATHDFDTFKRVQYIRGGRFTLSYVLMFFLSNCWQLMFLNAEMLGLLMQQHHSVLSHHSVVLDNVPPTAIADRPLTLMCSQSTLNNLKSNH